MLTESNYRITIRDTGLGIQTGKDLKAGKDVIHNSKGMQLTAERLDLWAKSVGGKYTLQINQTDPINDKKIGTKVLLTFPLNLTNNFSSLN